jgi:DNA polymerase (family 10)
MRLETAKEVAEQLRATLMPHCQRIEIVGSIRRHRPTVHDIDIVLIPKPYAVIMMSGLLTTIGDLKADGDLIKRVFLIDYNITVDIYIATPSSWATLVLIRTGSKENNIKLCSRARTKGWQLKASGDGLFNEEGERIAGDTEQSIYEALGIPYQEPQERQ